MGKPSEPGWRRMVVGDKAYDEAVVRFCSLQKHAGDLARWLADLVHGMRISAAATVRFSHSSEAAYGGEGLFGSRAAGVPLLAEAGLGVGMAATAVVGELERVAALVGAYCAELEDVALICDVRQSARHAYDDVAASASALPTKHGKIGDLEAVQGAKAVAHARLEAVSESATRILRVVVERRHARLDPLVLRASLLQAQYATMTAGMLSGACDALGEHPVFPETVSSEALSLSEATQSVPALLSHPLTRAYFDLYLRKTRAKQQRRAVAGAAGELAFLDEVSEFRALAADAVDDVVAVERYAAAVVAEFLAEDAPLKVDVEEEALKVTEAALAQSPVPRTAFDAIVADVVERLETEELQLFLVSPVYQQLRDRVEPFDVAKAKGELLSGAVALQAVTGMDPSGGSMSRQSGSRNRQQLTTELFDKPPSHNRRGSKGSRGRVGIVVDIPSRRRKSQTSAPSTPTNSVTAGKAGRLSKSRSSSHVMSPVGSDASLERSASQTSFEGYAVEIDASAAPPRGVKRGSGARLARALHSGPESGASTGSNGSTGRFAPRHTRDSPRGGGASLMTTMSSDNTRGSVLSKPSTGGSSSNSKSARPKNAPEPRTVRERELSATVCDAVRKNDVPMLVWCLTIGANPRAFDEHEGLFAVEIASQLGHTECADCLMALLPATV